MSRKKREPLLDPREIERKIINAMGAVQTTLTLLERQWCSESYVRLRVDCGTLLRDITVFPTIWLRLWFDDNGSPHQRAFTLVDPNVHTGEAWLEFALHEGVACDWARTAPIGSRIDASLLGSRFSWKDERPGTPGWETTLVVGDMAALPAINSLLDYLGDSPVTVVLDTTHEEDAKVPVRLRPSHTLVRCTPGGTPLEDEVAHIAAADNQRVWVALEAARTRILSKMLRKECHLPKAQLSALGYWRAEKA